MQKRFKTFSIKRYYSDLLINIIYSMFPCLIWKLLEETEFKHHGDPNAVALAVS